MTVAGISAKYNESSMNAPAAVLLTSHLMVAQVAAS
jgi:hypothetical protein